MSRLISTLDNAGGGTNMEPNSCSEQLNYCNQVERKTLLLSRNGELKSYGLCYSGGAVICFVCMHFSPTGVLCHDHPYRPPISR